jgi:transcriptional regulator with XRE-family HTH domain
MLVSNSDIGSAIRRRRQELLISQEALAEMMNVSHQQIQRYENGIDRLNVEKLQQLATSLSVQICYFFLNDADAGGKNGLECEELLANFRKINSDEMRALVVDFARTCAERAGGRAGGKQALEARKQGSG